MSTQVHSWSRCPPEHSALAWAPAHGAEFSLSPGKFRLVSDMEIGLSKLVSSPETPLPDRDYDTVVACADDKTIRFTVTEPAIYRVEFPNGGKGNTQLFNED